METLQKDRLQVLLSVGTDDPMRAELALQTALAAASCGVSVTLFLTQAGSVWGCQGVLPGRAGELQGMVDVLLSLDVAIECCASCAERTCNDSVVAGEWGSLRKGVVPTGLVTFASRSAQGCPTVTF
ncbi:MAG: DsrE family protein [Planctomycetes bacterium]|nr:DsrE family protein [Planctomycetota bacterium]